MREEISEPQQWRSHTRSKTGATSSSWVSRRQATVAEADVIESMPLEAVDAVFADESIQVESVRGSRRDIGSQKPANPATVAEQMQSTEGNDLLQNISDQLAMLKTQQEHLQKLLSQAQSE